MPMPPLGAGFSQRLKTGDWTMICGAKLRNGRSPARKRKLNGISLSIAQRLVQAIAGVFYLSMPSCRAGTYFFEIKKVCKKFCRKAPASSAMQSES